MGYPSPTLQGQGAWAVFHAYPRAPAPIAQGLLSSTPGLSSTCVICFLEVSRCVCLQGCLRGSSPCGREKTVQRRQLTGEKVRTCSQSRGTVHRGQETKASRSLEKLFRLHPQSGESNVLMHAIAQPDFSTPVPPSRIP